MVKRSKGQEDRSTNRQEDRGTKLTCAAGLPFGFRSLLGGLIGLLPLVDLSKRIKDGRTDGLWGGKKDRRREGHSQKTNDRRTKDERTRDRRTDGQKVKRSKGHEDRRKNRQEDRGTKLTCTAGLPFGFRSLLGGLIGLLPLVDLSVDLVDLSITVI